MFIWVPRFVDEVKGRRGLFEVDDKLGQKLLDAGLAQDPKDGAAALDPISNEKAVKKVVKKRRKKVVAEDEVQTEEAAPVASQEAPAEPDLLADVPADDS